ncbi:MAG: VOC family protein [Bacteroidota bacterium]
MAKLPMIILYVSDQLRSKTFYEAVLKQKPLLSVPGMTEFQLTDNFMLGLMPEQGISKIICPQTPNPSTGNGIPRCELYLFVEDPTASLNNAINAGAIKISKAEARDWGDIVSYCADPDGHVIAFAK